MMKKVIITTTIIIGIIFLIAIYLFFFKENNPKSYQQIEAKVIKNVQDYYKKNFHELIEDGEEKQFTLEELEKLGLLKDNIKNKCPYSYFIINNFNKKLDYQMCLICDTYITNKQICKN